MPRNRNRIIVTVGLAAASLALGERHLLMRSPSESSATKTYRLEGCQEASPIPLPAFAGGIVPALPFSIGVPADWQVIYSDSASCEAKLYDGSSGMLLSLNGTGSVPIDLTPSPVDHVAQVGGLQFRSKTACSQLVCDASTVVVSAAGVVGLFTIEYRSNGPTEGAISIRDAGIASFALLP